MGAEVDLIAGFRNKDIIILEDEMKNACTNLHIVTDDGSNGRKALVTQVLKRADRRGQPVRCRNRHRPDDYDEVCLRDHPSYGIKTIVSMNTIMVVVPACAAAAVLPLAARPSSPALTGFDFDGHLVDFDSAMRRRCHVQGTGARGGRSAARALQSVQRVK